MEAEIRRMNRFEDVREQSEGRKKILDMERKVLAQIEEVKRLDEKYFEVRAAITDMVGEVQRRLREYIEKEEREQVTSALAKWMQEVLARKEAPSKEEQRVEPERFVDEPEAAMLNPGELLELIRRSLVRTHWCRLHFVA